MVFKNKIHFELKIIQSVFLVASGFLDNHRNHSVFHSRLSLSLKWASQGKFSSPISMAPAPFFIQKYISNAVYIVMHCVNISSNLLYIGL